MVLAVAVAGEVWPDTPHSFPDCLRIVYQWTRTHSRPWEWQPRRGRTCHTHSAFAGQMPRLATRSLSSSTARLLFGVWNRSSTSKMLTLSWQGDAVPGPEARWGMEPTQITKMGIGAALLSLSYFILAAAAAGAGAGTGETGAGNKMSGGWLVLHITVLTVGCCRLKPC